MVRAGDPKGWGETCGSISFVGGLDGAADSR